MTAAVDTHSSPVAFEITAGRVLFEAWEGTDGRWYYHRYAGGNVTDTASYASRRSCRRAILARIRRGDA